MNTVNFRNDDVLQVEPVSKAQRLAWQDRPPFLHFLEADKIFNKYNYPCTLAILSEGIDEFPDWVEYIKQHQSRYIIELHGSSHLKYGSMSREQGKEDLKQAKEEIEDTFKTKITTWYVPFGRKNIPEWGVDVCKELGIKCDIPIEKALPYFYRQGVRDLNFHYWDRKQVEQVNNILWKNTK